MKTSGKYKRILVAVDGSDASFHALEQAFRLVENWITVVSVAPPYQGDLRLVGVHEPREVLTEPCGTALKKAQEMAGAAGAMIKPVCAVGEPYERIVGLAEAESRDLIVMGAKGHSLIEKVLLGSVTSRVIGYTRRDVLVVPPAAELAGWERLLLATDASQPAEAAAARALDLAQAYGSRLTVVAVMDFPAYIYGEAPMVPDWRDTLQSYVGEVAARAQSQNIAAAGQVLEGEAYREIVDLAQREKFSMIIMGSHGRTGLTRLLMGSVTERVIGHAPCPVLVVQE